MNDVIKKEVSRSIERLKELDTSSLEYLQQLRNLEVLYGADWLNDLLDYMDGDTDDNGTGAEIVHLVAPVEEEDAPADVKAAVVQAAAEVVAAKVAETAEEHPQYESAEVRTALVTARRNGVNVTELLREFGVDNFSAFPAGRYWELMERIG